MDTSGLLGSGQSRFFLDFRLCFNLSRPLIFTNLQVIVHRGHVRLKDIDHEISFEAMRVCLLYSFVFEGRTIDSLI